METKNKNNIMDDRNEYIKNEFLKCLYCDVLNYNNDGEYIDDIETNNNFLNELKSKIIIEYE